MLANRSSLLGLGVFFVSVCAVAACSSSNDGTPSDGTPDAGKDSTSSGPDSGVSDSGNGGSDTGSAADSGQEEDTSTGPVPDSSVADSAIPFPDASVVDAADAGPYPGCDGWGPFTSINVFDQWVWSGWQPNGQIGLTPDSCNLGDPLRPWEQVTTPPGAVGKCFVQHIDLEAQQNGWGAVAWYHWNPGDEGYPDQGQRIGNPKLLSICSAKSISFQVRTDVDGLVMQFASGDPGFEAASGPVTLTANEWKQVTMTYTGWVQLPVARGFYWVVDYKQQALQGKTSFNFYLDDAKILP